MMKKLKCYKNTCKCDESLIDDPYWHSKKPRKPSRLKRWKENYKKFKSVRALPWQTPTKKKKQGSFADEGIDYREFHSTINNNVPSRKKLSVLKSNIDLNDVKQNLSQKEKQYKLHRRDNVEVNDYLRSQTGLTPIMDSLKLD